MMQTHSYDTLVLVMGEIRGWLSISCCKQKLIFLSIFLGQNESFLEMRTTKYRSCAPQNIGM